MTKILPAVLIGICAFLAGTACALYLTMKLDQHLVAEIERSRFNPDFVPEIDARVNLQHIKAIEAGDHEWIVAWHCTLLARNLQLLNRTEVPIGRVDETRELAEEGLVVYKNLASEGRCGQFSGSVP